MKNYPKVVANVVTMNRKDLLKQCLDALTKQKYHLSAITVLDNGSTDGTDQMLLKEGYVTALPEENHEDPWVEVKEFEDEEGRSIRLKYMKYSKNLGSGG